MSFADISRCRAARYDAFHFFDALSRFSLIFFHYAFRHFSPA